MARLDHPERRILLPQVWAEDDVATKAIARNRVVHPMATPVKVMQPVPKEQVRKVGLMLDDERGLMAAHQPLPREAWDKASTANVLSKKPGALSSFAAAISSNERPERIVAATEFLRDSGLLEHCVMLYGRAATIAEMTLVHSHEHIEMIMSCQVCDPIEILKVSTLYNTVFMNQYSVDAALFAAGSTIEATEAVVKGELDSAVCIVRPPGHHAECDCAMGFGLFNSVAAAAAHAVNRLGLDRVLIVDWDIHHGNGTQEIFADDNRVLYFSAHGMYAFPAFARDGQMELQSPAYVGASSGQGFSCNCAWTDQSYGDAEYAALWERVLLPVASEYDPQLIIVSAGFDSAAGDEEGYMLTPSGYAYLLSQLVTLACGRLVVMLEGGYNIPAISHGLHACVATLMNVTVGLPSKAELGVPRAQAIADISNTMEAQKQFWQCLRAVK